MTKVNLYILGKKGFYVLRYFIEKIGAAKLHWVVADQDAGVEHDYFQEIEDLCDRNGINFSNRKDFFADNPICNIYSFCIGWRWIVKNQDNVIVFHDSPLPRYRGFAPLVNMLINGEKSLSVTALRAADDYDKGDTILVKSIDAEYPLKIRDGIDLLIPIYQSLVLDVYKMIDENTLVSCPQNHNEATYSLWRDELDYFIDWNNSSDKIARFCDSVGFPYKGARSYLNDSIICIIESKAASDVFVEDRVGNVGKVIYFNDENPVVVCGKGLLEIIEMKKVQENTVIRKIPFRSRFRTNL